MTAHEEEKGIGIQIAQCPLNKILLQESVQTGTKLCLFISTHRIWYWKLFNYLKAIFFFIACDWGAKSQEVLQTLLKIL